MHTAGLTTATSTSYVRPPGLSYQPFVELINKTLQGGQEQEQSHVRAQRRGIYRTSAPGTSVLLAVHLYTYLVGMHQSNPSGDDSLTSPKSLMRQARDR